MPEPHSRTLRVHQAADYIGVHPITIKRWAMNGTLPYMTLPGRNQEYRFTLEDCDALLASMRLPRKVVEAASLSPADGFDGEEVTPNDDLAR